MDKTELYLLLLASTSMLLVVLITRGINIAHSINTPTIPAPITQAQGTNQPFTMFH